MRDNFPCAVLGRQGNTTGGGGDLDYIGEMGFKVAPEPRLIALSGCLIAQFLEELGDITLKEVVLTVSRLVLERYLMLNCMIGGPIRVVLAECNELLTFDKASTARSSETNDSQVIRRSRTTGTRYHMGLSAALCVSQAKWVVPTRVGSVSA